MKDNGFLSLNNYRIPRENMLMRYAKVDKQGDFSMPANPKIGYGVMLTTRLMISCLYPRMLGNALTIAVRYSLMRK